MLNLAEVGPKDVLYDLGSGDGRILVAAAKNRDTRGVGIELDPLRIADAMEYAGNTGVEYLVDFVEESLFTADFSEATVITLYLLDSVNVQLRPRLLSELRPGARIVSHAFDMGEWKADERIKVNGITIYKWVVPAQIAGEWEWEGVDGSSYRVELRQEFQKISGNAWLDDEAVELKSAALCGRFLDLEIQDTGTQSIKRFTLNFVDSELQSVVEDV
ncbi:MAG: class I SAM-dependent methyltransferase [Burkholderiaceae bacterium]